MPDFAAHSHSTPLPRHSTLLNSRWTRITPNRLLVIMAFFIFFAELCDMLLLGLLPLSSRWAEAFLDSSILLLILSPVYFFLYRPVWQAHLRSTDEIRRLSRQLIRTEEATRKALARDLHDEFGQTLGALQLGIATLKNSLPAEQDQLAAQCDRLSRMTAQLGTHVRDVTAQLRPVMLDSLGLVPTLRWHLRQFRIRHPEVKVIMNLPEQWPDLSPEAELILYRVCQESLNNAAKHAKARRVRVGLSVLAGEVALEIEDDGVGFDAGGVSEATEGDAVRIGILGMRERVADGGGTIRIASQPGGGTLILAQLPLPGEQEAGR